MYEHPETIESCVFLSWDGDDQIGFGSYDPRKKSELGLVGHNCILPEFQRKGFGCLQLHDILRRLAVQGIKRAIATTLDHAFFEPARRLCLSCGFHAIERRPWNVDPQQNVIDYERALDDIVIEATS